MMFNGPLNRLDRPLDNCFAKEKAPQSVLVSLYFFRTSTISTISMDTT